MAGRSVASAVVPLALFVVACFAAGFLAAAFTDSWIAIAVAGFAAGSIVELAYEAVKRKRRAS